MVDWRSSFAIGSFSKAMSPCLVAIFSPYEDTTLTIVIVGDIRPIRDTAPNADATAAKEAAGRVEPLPNPSPSNSGPAELLHCQAGVPNLLHVLDLVAFELHHVDVVGFCLFARRRAGAALAGVGRIEDAVRRDALARLVDTPRLQLVAAIRHEGEEALHPVAVLVERLHVREGLRLRREGRVRVAVCLATLPALARLARLEELRCDIAH